MCQALRTWACVPADVEGTTQACSALSPRPNHHRDLMHLCEASIVAIRIDVGINQVAAPLLPLYSSRPAKSPIQPLPANHLFDRDTSLIDKLRSDNCGTTMISDNAKFYTHVHLRDIDSQEHELLFSSYPVICLASHLKHFMVGQLALGVYCNASCGIGVSVCSRPAVQ